MNETSINSAVVPALIYLNPNQAPNTAQSKTALAVSGKYWKYNPMQISKKITEMFILLLGQPIDCDFFLQMNSILTIMRTNDPCFDLLLHLLAAFRLLFLPLKIRSATLKFFLNFRRTKSIPETATWSQRCSNVSVDIKVLLYKTITIMFGYIHQISYFFSKYLENIFTKFYFCIISKQLLVDRV